MSAPEPGVSRRLAGLSVHLLTASGAVVAFLALQAAGGRDWTTMFWWLALALVIDGIDGTLARAVGIQSAAPRFSGEVLDLVVDYLTYVLVPVYALIEAGRFPSAIAGPLAAAILVSSAFYFADRTMKTPDGGFRGFPATWNVVAFLIFALGASPWTAAIAAGALVALTFAPFETVHPFRVARWRGLTLTMLALWSAAAGSALIADLAAPVSARVALALTSLYFLLVGLVIARPPGRGADRDGQGER